MTATASSALDVADRLFAAIESGDIAAVAELYTPATTVWHNYDRIAQDRDQNLRTLGWVVKTVRGIRYDEVRRQETPTGFVQQHVIRGTTASGAEVAIDACMVVRVVDGKIVRIEEYLDSAQTTVLSS